MKIITMDVTDINIPERNTRIHTKKQIEEFKRSVNMFGQIRPIVVDENNTILCGNGLYETLCSLGYKTADVYKVTGLSENQKKKLMIADNKIYGLGIDDIDVFDQFINELRDDLDIPGYDESVLQSMIADAEEITEEVCKYGIISEDIAHKLIKNHDKKEEKMLRGNLQEENNISESTQYQQPYTEKTDSNTEQFFENTTTEDKKQKNNGAYIICPDCGCKIWL